MPLGHYKRNGEADYLSVGGMETLYHPSDLVYRTTNDTVKKGNDPLPKVEKDGWYWMNNRDTCYTVVVNAEYNTYTGILDTDGDAPSDKQGEDENYKWTTITKTVSNNVRTDDGTYVKAFPGDWDTDGKTPKNTHGELSQKVYSSSSDPATAARWVGGMNGIIACLGSNMKDQEGKPTSELKEAMKPTNALEAEDYVGYFTNTQGGIYLAYKQLADSTATTYTEPLSNGVISTVARIPAAIIMSDGGANFALNEMGNNEGSSYSVKDWNVRYGQRTKNEKGEVTFDYMSDDNWGSASASWENNSKYVDGHNLDARHRLGGIPNNDPPIEQDGDEWYKVYLPGKDTLGEEWNGLHGLYNQGADITEDGTLTTPPAWNNAGVFYSSDNNVTGTAGTVMEVLLTASYMSEVVKKHYNSGWVKDNATQDSRIELSTYTMNVDTVHVPLWGRMRLYPTLDPKDYNLENIEEWYNDPKNNDKFGTDDEIQNAVYYDPLKKHITKELLFEGGTIEALDVIGKDADGNDIKDTNPDEINGLKQVWQDFKDKKETGGPNQINDNGAPQDIVIKPIPEGGTTYTNVGGEKIEITNDDVVNNIAYNDGFYDVTTENLGSTFSEILTLILGKVFVPVSGDNDAGVGDSITYQDPIGDYMEVKNSSVKATPHHIKESNLGGETTYDMAMLLFGEMHGLVRTGVYDYQWNNAYMGKHKKEEQGTTAFPMGWYKGDDPTSKGLEVILLTESDQLKSDDSGSWPKNYSSAEAAWNDGWVLRFDYKTLLSYVPIANAPADERPEDLSPQIKNTVYTVYRFACSKEDRNKLRINPVYGESVPKEINDAWENAGASGSYPESNEMYKSTPGVYRLSDIRVWVEDTGDFVDEEGAITPEGGYDRSLYLNIPAAAVPTELATITIGVDGVLSYKTNLGSDHPVGSKDIVVTKNSDGEEVENEQEVTTDMYNNYCYQSTPLRLFYAVGLEEDLIIRDEDGEQTGVNVAAISQEYINSHTVPDTSNIWFISNYYSNTAYDDYTTTTGDNTRGDPTVTFSPSSDNRYYVFQKPLPLYAHAYRVQADGSLKRVDGTSNNNGATAWEDGATGGTWPGGVYMGVYESEEAFRNAGTKTSASLLPGDIGMPKTEKIIKDSQGIWYPYVENGIVFLTGDLLDNVTEGDEGAKSFASDDYYFLLLEYYLPDGGTGVDDKGADVPGTQKGHAVQYAVARKGSEFGSGFASDLIDNGDMLCWTETQGRLNVNNSLGFEYLSRTDTGDNTRGEPTFEKLTLSNSELKEYLKKCGIDDAHIEEQAEYWQNMQKDPQVKAALDAADEATNGGNGNGKCDKDDFEKYFKFAVSARPGGIRSGNMANNVQHKDGAYDNKTGYYEKNVTETANNYYVPTVSESSSLEDIVLNSYLGNNGRLEIANSPLLVTKLFEVPAGYSLSDDPENETFLYQLYVNGLTGEVEATKVHYNPFSKTWQRRIAYIDVLTDNNGLLLGADNKPAMFVQDSGSARPVVSGTGKDGNVTYYYADGNGEQLSGSLTLYYLYLPRDNGSTSSRRIYQDTDYNADDKLENVTNNLTIYYGEGQEPSQKQKETDKAKGIEYKSTENSDFVGVFEYSVKDAELIPKSAVDNASTEVGTSESAGWVHKTEDHSSHQALGNYTLVVSKPNGETSANDISSLFSTRTVYMTETLKFGENANNDGTNSGALQASDLYDGIIPSADRPDLFKDLTAGNIAANTAEFTLKSGEGLLLTGLQNRIAYRFTEKLTDEQLEKGYTLKEISHVQQTGSDSVYRPGTQKIPIYVKADGSVTYEGDPEGTLTHEPFHHTNAVMWEYYATFDSGTLSSHHYPRESSDGILQNPNCEQYNETDKAGCDVATDDGKKTLHYMYREGELVDPHYQGEPSSFLENSISRYLVSPTVHFGVGGETQESVDKTFPADPSTNYNGVYSVFGNTGYFEEQANYINTIKTAKFKLIKKLVDESGEDIAEDDQEFTFEISFKDITDQIIDYDLEYEIYELKKTSEVPDTFVKRGKLLKTDSSSTSDEDIVAKKDDDGSRVYWTVKLKKDQYIVVSGLPYNALNSSSGFSYIVTEVGLDESKEYSAKAGEPRKEGSAGVLGDIVELEFINEKKFGSLTVHKIISLENGDSASTDLKNEKDTKFSFKLVLENGGNIIKPKIEGGIALEPVDGEMNTWSFTLKGGESAKMSGIPIGTKYTVEETNIGFWKSEISVNDDNSEDADTVATGIIENSTTEYTVTFDNKKPNPEPVKVSIGLTKNVTITGADEVFEEYDKINAGDFKFEVTPDTGNGENDPFTEYTKDKPYIVSIGASNPESKYTATANIFTNLTFEKAGTYKYHVKELWPDSGENSSKKIDGMTYSTVEYTIEVVVSEITVTVGETTKLGLKTIVYVYTGDTRAEDLAPVASSEGDTYTDTVDAGNTFVTFKNTIGTGKLVISKEVVNAPENDSTSFEFTLNLKENGKNLTGPFPYEKSDGTGGRLVTELSKSESEIVAVDGMWILTLKGGESITIDELPVGAEYTVTELEVKAPYAFKLVSGGTINNQSASTASGVIKSGETDTENTVNVDFINEYNTGSIRVEKKLAGADGAVLTEADNNVPFTFTLSLNPPDGATLDGVVFKNGENELELTPVENVYTFQLKANETVEVTGIPYGTSYILTETEAAGFDSPETITDSEGIIDKDTPAISITVTNTKPKPESGSLTILKIVKDKDGETVEGDTTAFDFKIKLTAPNGESLPENYKPGDDGFMYVPVTVGSPIHFDDLPIGTKYEVTEIDSKDYTCEEPIKTGIIADVKEELKVEIVNIEPEPEVVCGSLTVSKTVVGDSADSSASFKFTLNLANPDGTAFNGEYSSSGDEAVVITDGHAEFWLGDGESVTISDLPV